MTGRFRAIAIGLVVIGAVLVPAAVTIPEACATAAGPHAALVVDTGSAVRTFCVTLDAPSVSGSHLIELAGTQRGLAYAFGFGGQAVCRLAGTGPGGGDCFASYPSFWGYWQGDRHGGWSWSATGPGDTDVGDGDIDGWVWGTGDSGATHGRPPATTAAEVCAAQTATPSATAATASPDNTSPRAASTAIATAIATTTPPPAGGPSVSTAPTKTTAVRTSSVDTVVQAAGQVPPGGGGGSPAGLFLALGLLLVLAGAGWLRIRSTRKIHS